MGNSGSINNITTQIDEQTNQQSWQKVLTTRNDAIKVLPKDCLIGARLRSTNNGNILHSGGTLTGSKKQNIQRSKSITETNFKQQINLMNRSQTQLEIIPRQTDLNIKNLILTKKIGSVPDLRNSEDKQRGYIKKYRAPQLPLQHSQKIIVDYDPCRFGWKTKIPSPILDSQPRKLRLFKTKAEQTKKLIQTRKLTPDEEINRLSDTIKNTKTNFFQIPQFRREKSFDVSLLKPLPPPITETFEKTKSLKKIKENSKIQQNFQEELLAATKKRQNQPILEKSEQLPKTFYFGMNENQENEIYQNSMNQTQLDEIDKFASSLLKKKKKKSIKKPESSESALSSDCDEINQTINQKIIIDDNCDISLQLRPTLPKKQFDVPRFSPAAAWRQLSTTTTTPSDDNDFYNSSIWDETNSEIRIERILRQHPILPDNKSGDSGISGDAGLPEPQYSPQTNKILNKSSAADDELLLKNCENYLSAWTPQQDLGDDDDDNDDDDDQSIKIKNTGHIFSLSLPRDHLVNSQFGEKPEKSYNSLKKLKRTVSGAFGQQSINQLPIDENLHNENWFLSCSGQNSIDNIPAINNLKSTDDEIKPKTCKKPNSFNYLKTGRHIIYLPNHTLDETSDYKLNDKKIEKIKENQTVYSKKGRENLQDLPASPKELTSRNSKIKTGHRFTFQSTVRQIERKRLSDKLSKEAEQKEAQRLSELEAMRRVEEEFQKKRAREKATIRQQLRLYSLEENQINLPCDFGVRLEPEGATFESLNDVSYQIENKLNPTTEILSEFRTQRREYVEYRGEQQTPELNLSTEYPIVYCNIPVSGEFSYGGNSDNYRRHFARGISVGSSDSEISHSSGRNRSKQAQYRQRSPSPSGLY